MSYNRILTIQDVSCLGQCSGTVALPIISACGQECAIIPSAVLSTHTGGFTGFTFADLTEEIPKIRSHWEKEGLTFDCVYTGYLGSVRQIGYVADIIASTLRLGGMKIIDPAMADNGKLYTGFGQDYVDAMRTLCSDADIVLPNITEACMLTGMNYETEYDEEYIKELCRKLQAMGAKNVVMTGVSFKRDYTGVYICEGNDMSHYEHELIRTEARPNGWHGTGDVFASAFVGALFNGLSYEYSAKVAADFVVASIKATLPDESHWYGVRFETQLPKLIKDIEC